RALIWGVVTGVDERAIFDPGIEQTTDLQELDKEGQLPERRDGCGRIPFDVDTAPEGIEYYRFLGL
ncbi:MAG TPA: hypothetical protein VMV40_07170, partial [Acidiferrobacter sp.]|nr:hypothetical protein [Acidiferrobacter sp.]